jgi:hypothetical protein
MATRRMISKDVICSDRFVEMPYISQALYYQLLINADDDGFVANPNQITRSIGASDSDVEVLIDREFIYKFRTGIVVIKHWQAQNKVQSDRYKSTKFVDERKQLSVNTAKEYVFVKEGSVSRMDTKIPKVVSIS